MISVFGTTEIVKCVEKILDEGSIQLTTSQRKKIIEDKRIKIIHQIATTATDPRTKLPHPKTRIELALEEIRFSIDPFLSVDRQVQDAIKLLKPVIPLSFVTMRLAFKVPGSDYGGVHRIVRESIKKEEWLSDGSWFWVVEVPGGMKNELISQVAQRSSEVSVKELD